MATKARHINSLEQFQRVVPAIVKAVNADPRLALRAAANPLLAAEELGYTIDPDVRRQAEQRVRFAPETIERLAALEAQVYEYAGEAFAIDSGEALGRVLFDKLKLAPPDIVITIDEGQVKSRAASRKAASRPKTDPLPPRVVDRDPVPDPLEPLRDAHPIMVPLLEYRQLEAGSARLAPPALYKRIGEGGGDLPIGRIRFTLQRGPTPE